MGGVIERRHLGANIEVYRTGYRGQASRADRSVDAVLCPQVYAIFLNLARHIQVREMPYLDRPCSLPQSRVLLPCRKAEIAAKSLGLGT